jgi:hypothetical protein
LLTVDVRPNDAQFVKSCASFGRTSMVSKSGAIEICGGGHLRKRPNETPSYSVRRLA